MSESNNSEQKTPLECDICHKSESAMGKPFVEESQIAMHKARVHGRKRRAKRAKMAMHRRQRPRVQRRQYRRRSVAPDAATPGMISVPQGLLVTMLENALRNQ